MTKLSDIIDGFRKTFYLDDIQNPKPRQSVCRECEIVASAACFSASAYIFYITRLGRILPVPGHFISCVIFACGCAFIVPPADDEVLQAVKRIQNDRVSRAIEKPEEGK